VKVRDLMLPLIKTGLLLSAFSLALNVFIARANAQDLSAPVCDVVVYDERVELEDARIAVDRAKSTFGAYERIFEMIKRLWDAETIPYMDYLKAKYDRDAAKLTLEKADLILERQTALVEQYRLICNGTGSGREAKDRAIAIRNGYLRYRRADCSSLAKAIEVATTNLEFNREYLKKIAKLRQENFATNTQVILAELNVELEEKSLADAKRRTASCRGELNGLESSAGTAPVNTQP
jgi:hypothetical protein